MTQRSLPTLEKLLGSVVHPGNPEPGGNWDALPGSQSETRDRPRRSRRVVGGIPPDSQCAGLKLRPRPLPPPLCPSPTRAARRVGAVRAQAPRRGGPSLPGSRNTRCSAARSPPPAMAFRAKRAGEASIPGSAAHSGLHRRRAGFSFPESAHAAVTVLNRAPRRGRRRTGATSGSPRREGRARAASLRLPRALSRSAPPPPRVLAVVEAADATPRHARGGRGLRASSPWESCGPGAECARE